MKARAYYNKFNRGEIDPRALDRNDVEKVRNSAATVENWLPQRLGSMQTRPGTEYLGTLNGASYMVPFVAGVDDTALLEFSDQALRVWVDDEVVSVTSGTGTITNTDFSAGLSGWTATTGGNGHVPTWDSGGYATMFSDWYDPTKFYQDVAISTGSSYTVKIVTLHNPVDLRLYDPGGTGPDIFNGTLQAGTHYLTFSSGSVTTVRIEFSKLGQDTVYIDSCDFYTGDIEFVTSIAEADLSTIRYNQSADVVFLAADGERIKRVERRSANSWSYADVPYAGGPFGIVNSGDTRLGQPNGSVLQLLPAKTSEMQSTAPIFSADDVGSIYRVYPTDDFISEPEVVRVESTTPPVHIYGYGSANRAFSWVLYSDVGSTTVAELERSVNGPDGDYANILSRTFGTAGATGSYDDSGDLNGVDAYYRWRLVDLGTANYATLGIYDVESFAQEPTDVKVIEYNSATSVEVVPLTPGGSFLRPLTAGGDEGSLNWQKSEWSDTEGWPTAVALHEGRLWWAGRDKIWASATDNFTDYDATEEGDAASIQKSVGFGPVNEITWLAPISRLVAGTATDEISVRSNAFGEPLTPTNCNLKSDSTQGSSRVDAVKVDQSLFFVQRSGTRLYELSYSGANDAQSGTDLTTLNPSICDAGIKRIAVTRQPETRVFCVMDDGTGRVLTIDKAENVLAWSRFSTEVGTYEDVAVLPSEGEDRVYFVVKNGSSYYLEKMSLQTDCEGGTTSKHFDSHVFYASTGTTVTGLSHLEGKEVYGWTDGGQIGPYTVSSGQITIASSATNLTVGMQYIADWKSNKLREYTNQITGNLNSRILRVAVTAQNVLPSGLTFGDTFTNLQALPGIKDGKAFDQDIVLTDYEDLPVEFDGIYDVDTRVCIRSTGPATILSMMVEVDEPNYSPANQG